MAQLFVYLVDVMFFYTRTYRAGQRPLYKWTVS